MKRRIVLSAIGLVVLVPWTSAAIAAQDLPPAKTTAPAGEYQVARLTLERAWEGGRDLTLVLGFRGGRSVTAWHAAAARSDAHHLWLDKNGLTLDGETLRGEFGGRMVKVWAPMQYVGDYTWSLEATVANGRVSGTYAAGFAGEDQDKGVGQKRKVAGKLTGRLLSPAELQKECGLSAGKEWPGYYGVGAAFRGPDCGARLVADLTQARPLWKSEEPLPCMWGKGPDARYKTRACLVGVDGGASSPVVAGGLVYCFYFRPTGPLPDKLDELQLRAEAAKVTPSPIGRQAFVDWHRTQADDVLVALDAASGAIVWKTELPGRAVNHQTHKWRGYNPVPFVADGVVYAVNYANRIYALDAKTGKLLWEFGKGSTKFTASAVGPVAVDGVVVACIGEMVGLDAKTGKELWKGPAGNIRPWQHVGRTWIIATGADVGRKGAAPMNVWCVEPKIGRVAWKAETPLWGAGDVYPIVEGDYLIGYDATKGEKAGEADFSRNTLVRCYRLKEDGVEPLWAVPAPYPAIDKFALCAAGGNVYVAGAAETFCLSLGDGRKLGTAKAGGARTQKMFVADGRVLIQPEGRHGGQAFFQLDADPAAFRLLPASGGGATKHTGEGQWVPPHTHDTAYANHPVGYPLIDGRLFVRGHDGIYCYDLRAAGNEKGR